MASDFHVGVKLHHEFARKMRLLEVREHQISEVLGLADGLEERRGGLAIMSHYVLGHSSIVATSEQMSRG